MSKKLLLLDLFCGAGGAARGYADAGFEIVGVDNQPQPNYPFEFQQADAMTYPLEGFDVIHASPPCQRYVRFNTPNLDRFSHPDLVGSVRERLQASGLPWIIENVPGAPMRSSVQLCGSMFDLIVGDGELRRHRLFETNFPVVELVCNHSRRAITVCSKGGGYSRTRPSFPLAVRKLAMGINWMTDAELAESVPPAYTCYVGRQLLKMR